jgi:hypothetical protein
LSKKRDSFNTDRDDCEELEITRKTSRNNGEKTYRTGGPGTK